MIPNADHSVSRQAEYKIVKIEADNGIISPCGLNRRGGKHKNTDNEHPWIIAETIIVFTELAVALPGRIAFFK